MLINDTGNALKEFTAKYIDASTKTKAAGLTYKQLFEQYEKQQGKPAMSAEQVTLQEIFRIGEERTGLSGSALDLDTIAEKILNQDLYEAIDTDPDCSFKVRL